ncbi:unnamed protein product [Schistosoma curassoni]|uniref:RNase_PH domain-containing protein n=1 Tax=Schistosoma curassoni TaxID=6186 RepID=A0A183KC81_9TREM|nr:unnamed protein product [Schistosoma curassoni]
MIFWKTVDQNEKEHQIQYTVCKPKNMGLLDYGRISIFLDEAKIHDELTHRAYVDVTVTPRTGQRTSKESELEVYLNNLLERLIDVKEFPRSKFTGRLFIVTGGTNHPRTVAAAINAISLALLLSGLPLRATIASVCHTIQNACKLFILNHFILTKILNT